MKVEQLTLSKLLTELEKSPESLVFLESGKPVTGIQASEEEGLQFSELVLGDPPAHAKNLVNAIKDLGIKFWDTPINADNSTLLASQIRADGQIATGCTTGDGKIQIQLGNDDNYLLAAAIQKAVEKAKFR